jgi:hypothetical protein
MNATNIKREQRHFQIHRYEAEEVLVPHYRNEAKRFIESALWWKKHPELSGNHDLSTYRRYLAYAKNAAQNGQRWAEKLGVHFGRLPKKAKVAA